MNDPYKILGVPYGASQEQIKAAYRELSRKYQNESYRNGPLADAAQHKLDELNEAYDQIILSQADNNESYYDSGNSTAYNTYSSPDPTEFNDIRERIRRGQLEDAMTLLEGIYPSQRTAQWYYLKGTVLEKQGWLEEAAKNFETACNMDPENSTYKATLGNIRHSRNGGYRTVGRDKGGKDCSVCEVCSAMMCLDCCCEGMGGDCIPCC